MPPYFILSDLITSYLIPPYFITCSHITSHLISAHRGFVGRRRALSAGLRRAHVLTLSAGVTQLQALVRGAFSRKATRRKKRSMAQNRLRGGSVALIQAAYRGHRFDTPQCVCWAICTALSNHSLHHLYFLITSTQYYFTTSCLPPLYAVCCNFSHLIHNSYWYKV